MAFGSVQFISFIFLLKEILLFTKDAFLWCFLVIFRIFSSPEWYVTW